MTSGPLYRNSRRSVIVATLAALLVQYSPAQAPPHRPKQDKGPRAVGLVELAPNGKAQLIPVVIMYNGEFYDAGAYKASPVPMALESGIVYEAERTGVSQGLFTVTAALQGPNNTWKAEGRWLPEGAKPANAPHKAETKPRDIEQEEGPPVLRRREPKAPEPESQAPPPAAAPPAPAATPAPPAATPAAPAPTATASNPPAPPPAEAPAEEDPNKPVLRRGKPAPAPPAPSSPPQAASKKPSSPALGTNPAKTASPSVQVIPAISDAAGPEPRPYTFSAKPEDEAKLRAKMLEIAAAEVKARVRQIASATVAASAPPAAPRKPAPQKPATARANAKEPQVQFDNLQLRMFDLSTSNEAVLVLTATAHLPQKGLPDTPYLLTLVARQDIYGELHKALSNVTDAEHLDVTPRMDLIDAVDVDGDGRGELLFRKTSDTGSAFAVYRVIGDRLWPLFEGTPGV